jgi:AraC-like DNA-binding protein
MLALVKLLFNLVLTMTRHINIFKTFGPEANRLTAGIITADRATYGPVERAFDTYTIAYLLGGSATYIGSDGVIQRLETGYLLQRLPGRKHTLNRTRDGQWTEFHLAIPLTLFKSLAGLGALDSRREILHPGVNAACRSRIDGFLGKMKDLVETNPLEALIEAQRLLAELYTLDRTRTAGNPDAEVLQRACLMLGQAPAGRDGMEEIAAASGMGYEKFRKLFAQRFGVPPKQYRLRQRIDAAKRMLLERALTLKEIAYALGFTDVANFANHFKRATGVSPGVFRKRV